MQSDEPSVAQLLLEYCKLQDTIRERGLRFPGGDPVAGYAEALVCERLHLCCKGTEEQSHDAVDPNNGNKYEVKHTRAKRSTPQTGRISGLGDHTEEQPFHFLIFVVFNSDLTIRNVYQLTYDAVWERKRWNAQWEGYYISMSAKVRDAIGVEDIRCKFHDKH